MVFHIFFWGVCCSIGNKPAKMSSFFAVRRLLFLAGLRQSDDFLEDLTVRKIGDSLIDLDKFDDFTL